MASAASPTSTGWGGLFTYATKQQQLVIRPCDTFQPTHEKRLQTGSINQWDFGTAAASHAWRAQ
jgi:hypothetical protein